MAEKTQESIERAQLVRAYEASCRIDVPSDEEKKFRAALMIKLALAFGLKDLRKRYAFEDGGRTGPFTRAGKAECPHN